MYIIILGGQNDKEGNLSNCTIKRLDKFYEIYNLHKNINPKIIISGGCRFSNIPHCFYIKQKLLDIIPDINITKEFIENDTTIDEAINMCEYFKNVNYYGNIIIITSNWHMERVKYLFNKVFELINNIKIEYIETNEHNKQIEIEEVDKLYNLKYKPYGKWSEYIINIYMNEIVEKEFEKEFGVNDNFKENIITLINESYINIKNLMKKEKINTITQQAIWSLWIKNKHYYQYFISRMIGKLMNLYNFNNEYSIYCNDYVKNIDTSLIDSNLRINGYHILDNKLSEEKCINIKKKLPVLNFRPFNSQRNIIGEKFLNKNVVIDNSTTFWIHNQSDILSINEVQELATDPFILKIVQNYLSCNPILCQTNCWYSCVGNKAERTQQFHQDYDDINFLKIFIYLTDVDESSGPHSCISTSINNIIEPPNYEPSTRLTDTFAMNKYGDKIKVFTGKMGTIIIENTNGFHRGMPVQHGNRLILQLQYSSTLLPLQQGCKSFNLEKTEFMKKYSNSFLMINN